MLLLMPSLSTSVQNQTIYESGSSIKSCEGRTWMIGLNSHSRANKYMVWDGEKHIHFCFCCSINRANSYSWELTFLLQLAGEGVSRSFSSSNELQQFGEARLQKWSNPDPENWILEKEIIWSRERHLHRELILKTWIWMSGVTRTQSIVSRFDFQVQQI